MSITRASAESILIKRVGPLMTRAGMDGATDSGGNRDLNDPIGWSLRQCGYSVTNPALVTSAEVAGVADASLDKFLDLAELRALENIAGNLDDVNWTAGPRSEQTGALVEQVERKLARVLARCESEYDFGGSASLQAGVITMEIAEHYDGTE